MSKPRVFISFDVDHNSDEKVFFEELVKNSSTPIFIQDWSVQFSMPESEWEASVEKKINRCNMVIVLVGKYMASANGVVREIKIAKDQGVPVFGVYVGDANRSSNFPDGLNRTRVITWDWGKIENAINQVMIEGGK